MIAHLTQLPGIGRWSAEWFLARTLGRPRVVAGDLGVRKAIGRLYQVGMPSEDETRRLTEHWGPAANVAQALALHDLALSSRRLGLRVLERLIFATRRAWRPPWNSAVMNASTHPRATSRPMMRAPIASTLASLCSRPSRAVTGSCRLDAADAADLVGHDLLARAAAAEHDAALAVARGDRSRGRRDVVGVVDRGTRQCPPRSRRPRGRSPSASR